MAKYRITGPDGGTYEITAPDDASEADVLAYAQENYSAPSSPDFSGVTSRVLDPAADRAAAQAAAQQSVVDEMGFGERALAGAGQSVDSNLRGIGQLATQGARNALLSGAASLSGLGLGGVGRGLVRDVVAPLDASLAEQQAEIDTRREIDAPLLNTAGGLLGNIGGHVAQLAIPAGEVGALTRGASLGARAAASVPTGAALGSIAPVATGESRAQNAVIGGLLGPAGELLGSGLGAVVRRAGAAVDPIKERALALAREQGIPLHISQISDSIPVKTMASVAKYLPFSGAGSAASRQQGAFNRAVGRTFGADSDKLTDEVVGNARRGMSSRFQEIYDRNAINLGEANATRLSTRQNEISEPLLQEEARVVDRYAGKIRDEIVDGQISGPIYQRLRSNLMEAEKRSNPGVSAAIRSLRGELDEIAAESVGAADAAALKKLRGQWANFRTTEKALAQVAGAGGDVRPAALWPLVRNGSTSEMRELARLGQVVLKDPIPDSGTAGRSISAGVLSGLGSAGAVAGLLGPLAGGLLGGATVGRALNSPAAAGLLATHPVARTAGLLGRIAAPGALVTAPVAASANNRRRKPKKSGRDERSTDD